MRPDPRPDGGGGGGGGEGAGWEGHCAAQVLTLALPLQLSSRPVSSPVKQGDQHPPQRRVSYVGVSYVECLLYPIPRGTREGPGGVAQLSFYPKNVTHISQCHHVLHTLSLPDPQPYTWALGKAACPQPGPAASSSQRELAGPEA